MDADISGYQFNDLSFHERSYTRHDGRASHSHDELFLIFVLQGKVHEVQRRQTFMRTPSTLMLIPPDEPHATDFYGDVKTFEIALLSPWIERIRQYYPLAERSITCQNGLPNWLALRLYNEFQQRDRLSPLVLEGLLLELLAQMARSVVDNPETSRPRWLRQVHDFLHAHFTESLSLDLVASTVDVHPAHLIRAFRQHYGCTLGDYVRRLRVEHASHLLSTSELPLAQIALETGFADQSHFSRTFKSLTGMTPTEYQKASGCAGLRQTRIP